jgi:L-cysteine desulfidase
MSEELESELVEFKVILDSVWHNEPPKFQVLLDGELIESGVVTEKEEDGEEKTITFSKQLYEGDHTIQIRLVGKQNHHTPIDEKGNILADQLLNIKQVEVDEIELDNLFYQLGKYHKQNNPIDAIEPLYEAEPLPDSYKNLGWNGEWRLHFTVPTYMWFLENL